MSKILCFVALSLALTGCAKKTGTEEEAEEAVSTGIGALSAAVIAENATSTVSRTTCGSSAVSETCTAKERKATYTDCPIGSTDLKYSGTVTLTYSRAACTLVATDDTVTRTVDITRDALLGATVATSSASHTDYRGTTVGGGSVMTKTADGRTVAIAGLHKERTSAAGKKVIDISLRTTAPLVLTGISGDSLTVASGTVEVIHNLAEYTATFTSENLVYDSSACCYPTSGTISVAYDGSITGTGSVAFGSCGTATFTRNSVEKAVTLAGCE